MSAMTCPHCGATNANAGAFCESCGKALPSATPSTPRVISSGTIASTAEGQRLQSENLHKQSKKAANALLTVAVLTTLGALFIGFVVFGKTRRAGEFALYTPASVVVVGVVAAIYYALYGWARKSPLPAAIVGLVLFISLQVADVIGTMAMMNEIKRQNPGMEFSGPPPIMNGLIIKIIIIVMFVRAIQAGIEHRKLLRHQAGQVPQPVA